VADQVSQRKQGYSKSFKDYMIDIQTTVRPLNYLPRETLRIIKGNCTPSLMIFLREYKMAELDTLMILADEYEKLEKEREAFAQENIEQEMANDLSRREASGGHTVHSKLTGKLIEKEQQLSAAVMIGGNSNKATIDTGKT